MLTGIGLRNFKAFGDSPNVLTADENGKLTRTDTAPLSKITLIYGPNSGGKSSILQALLLLKQSLKSHYSDTERTLVPRGEFVDLGSFQALIHNHDNRRELGIYLQCQKNVLGHGVQNRVSVEFTHAGNFSEMSNIRFQITANDDGISLVEATCEMTSNTSLPLQWRSKIVGIDENRSAYITSRRFLPLLVVPELVMARAQQLNPDIKLATPMTFNFHLDATAALERLGTEPRERTLGEELFQAAERVFEGIRFHNTQSQEPPTPLETEKLWQELKADPGYMEWQESTHLSHLKMEKELEEGSSLTLALVQELSKLSLSESDVISTSPEDIADSYEHHLNLINYLGPLRSAPERTYRLSPENPLLSGVTGLRGEYSANVLYHNNSLKDDVNWWFNGCQNEYNFGIPYELTVIPLGDPELSGEHITITLSDRRTDAQVTIADVGYGINQILPVIIEGVASQEGSIICVEQPEIHLHPRLQANVADLMIDTIADEPGKRKQWIVETHSELLILRLQRRIREGKIKPEDISVLYVDPNDESTEGSAIKVLRLGEDSYFKDPWPDGFFADSLKEQLAPDDDDHGDNDEDADILEKLFSAE